MTNSCASLLWGYTDLGRIMLRSFPVVGGTGAGALLPVLPTLEDERPRAAAGITGLLRSHTGKRPNGDL
jgi:hypothetical protein